MYLLNNVPEKTALSVGTPNDPWVAFFCHSPIVLRFYK